MKRYIGLFILTAAVFTQYSCKKQLDALPNDALVEGNTITNQQSANIALNGVYYRFANASSVQTNWLEEEINGGILTGFLDDGINTDADAQNDLGNTAMNDQWGTYYTLVNAANGVIQGVEPLNSSIFSNNRKAQILAEAKFMRAYAHFKLLLWFGQWWNINSNYGVILRNNFITSTNIPQARANVKDTYNFILNDVNTAIDSAADNNGNIYVNKWSAMALKMRVLLSRGQGDDYTQCISIANSIINNGPFKLEANLQDIFYSKGLSSAEVMLGVQPQPSQGAYYYNTSGNYVVRNTYYVATGALDSLLANDPRQAWIVGDTAAYGKGFYFIKYVQPALATTQLSEVAYAFRLSEVYLMEAEALARSGGSLATAKGLLETVMSHAGVTDFTAVDAANTSDALLKQIYYEYVKNFIGEDGQCYWALLRFPLTASSGLTTVTKLRPTITSMDQYILPIPHDEFTSNPLIGNQNPGYSK